MAAASYTADAIQLHLELGEIDRGKNEEQYMVAEEDDSEGHVMLCYSLVLFVIRLLCVLLIFQIS